MRTGSATITLVALALVLVVEAAVLCLGQRRLFWLAVDATGSRFLGYLLAMPGTVLHESAHYLACVILRVRVGRKLRTRDGRRARVRLFFPVRDPVTGSVTLGMVPHARTDPVRGALIAIAPLLLVPPVLLAIAFAFAFAGTRRGGGELVIVPDTSIEAIRDEFGVRPLTSEEWNEVLEEHGPEMLPPDGES